MSKSNFPSLEKLEDKIKHHIQAPDLYALIEKSVSILIGKKSDYYSNDEKNFLKDHLCKVIARTIRYDHRSSLDDSILNLFNKVADLVVSTKLNSYAILSLTPFFDIDYHEPHIFKVKTEDFDNVYDFSNSLFNSEMIILKSNTSSFNEKLLSSFFDKSILNTMLSMIDSNEINIQQISSIMLFFTKIQSFLNDRLSLSLEIYFAQYSLKLLTSDQYGSDGVSAILTFFKTFLKHLFNLQAEIFHLSTEMLHYQNQNQYEALVLFLAMVQNSKVTQNQKTIKKALLSLLQQTTNIKIFQEIYENFSMLSKEIMFTDDDITNFVCYIRKIPNDANRIILNLLPCISNPFLKPINNILLGLNLISCTDNEALSNLILARTIQNFDKKCNLNSNSFKMTEKMASLIISSLNLNQGNLDLINLGYFLSYFPRHDVIHEYIMKITEEEDFECYLPILKRLALSSTKFESEKLLYSFAQSVIDQFVGRRFTPRISRLTEVVVNWITNFSSIPENQIFSKLIINIDYYKCPDEIPSIISALMSRRTSNRRLIRQLINKIMKDTVPEKHANWAINMAFDALHDEKRDIEKIAENLFQYLSENNKKTNVIYMIYQAVLYEADFYNIGKINEKNGIKIEATLNGQPFNFSIHPLHSARRLYTEVGKFLQKRLFNFTLYIKGKEILPDQPLSSVPFKFDANKKLNITVKIDDNANRNDYCRLHLQPYFIEYMQRTERFTTLFSLMNNFSTESEILFLILNLIDNETIKPVLSSPIQQIFRRDYFMSFVDLESFRLFPFVLDAARGSKTVYSSGYLSTVFQKLNDQYLDQVSLLMTCRILASCEAESCHFEASLIRKCLITCGKKNIREAMANILTKTDEKEKLLSLLFSTAQITNRNKTKQFFNLLKKKEIDPHLVEPLLKLANQYETNFDGEIDQTINGILSMDLFPNADSFDSVFRFLFTPPTVRSKFLPFLHKLKSREKAYKFILKYDDCISKLSSILLMVPMSSSVRKLDDNFSYYKRGFLSPLNFNTSVLILLHSVESIRNYAITTSFECPTLIELSNLFFEMSFTCMPSIDINNYALLISNEAYSSYLYNLLKKIYVNQGSETPFFDLFQITCPNNEKIKFSEKCEKLVTEKSSKIIFFDINNRQHNKFKFPLFFGDYNLRAVAIKSDDNDYSVIYRGPEINDTTDLIDTKENYLFDKYSKSCWFIAENDELSKYDISELPDRCFGGKKKKESAFLLVYEHKDIEIPKMRVDKGRQEEIDLKNLQNWPSVVCNSRGFVNFSRELFETNVDRYLKFGLDVFFKIAIIDDFSLNDWKTFLIEKVLIDERKSEVFLENFVSNEALLEKVDLSKNGTFVLPELFAFAKKKFNIKIENAFNLIQLFEKADSQKQFGFVCDILAILLSDSEIDLSKCRYLLSLLTDILKKIDSVYKIYDRVLSCFESLMVCVSNLLSNSDDSLIDDLIQPDFLEKWLEIGKKSDTFKSILESILKNNTERLSEESSLVMNKILDNSQLPFSPVPSLNSPVLPNSPILGAPKRIKTIKLIKRKNRPNNEFADHNETNLNSEEFDEFNDASQVIQQETKNEQSQSNESSIINNEDEIHDFENENHQNNNDENEQNNDDENDQNNDDENDQNNNDENDQNNDDENDQNNDDENEQNNENENEFDHENGDIFEPNEISNKELNETTNTEDENEEEEEENGDDENAVINNGAIQNTVVNLQFTKTNEPVSSIFNISNQAEIANTANVFNTNNNEEETGNNANEYSYSSDDEEDEEEETIDNQNETNNFVGVVNSVGDENNIVLNNENNSSDFIVISNSNSENNLTRNSSNNSNDNFILISNSNDDLINNDQNVNENRNSGNNNDLPFDFAIKSDSESSAE